MSMTHRQSCSVQFDTVLKQGCHRLQACWKRWDLSPMEMEGEPNDQEKHTITGLPSG